VGQFKRDYNRLTKETSIKQVQHDALVKETSELWASLGENSKKIRQNEMQVDARHKKLASLRSEYLRDKTAVQLSSRRLRELNERKARI
jgi:hypothetical protein